MNRITKRAFAIYNGPMKRVAIIFSLLSICVPTWPSDLILEHAPAHVFFSPRGGCTAEVVSIIETARKSLLVQAYSFTSVPIAQALKAAHDRGVDVRIILDKSDETGRSSMEGYLVRARIPIWIDRAHAIAHNKVMVIDGTTVITGSFNFTKAAETSNAENLLVIQSLELADLYSANWVIHQHHSEPGN